MMLTAPARRLRGNLLDSSRPLHAAYGCGVPLLATVLRARAGRTGRWRRPPGGRLPRGRSSGRRGSRGRPPRACAAGADVRRAAPLPASPPGSCPAAPALSRPHRYRGQAPARVHSGAAHAAGTPRAPRRTARRPACVRGGAARAAPSRGPRQRGPAALPDAPSLRVPLRRGRRAAAPRRALAGGPPALTARRPQADNTARAPRAAWTTAFA